MISVFMKKRFCGMLLGGIIFLLMVLFLWPRSLLHGVDEEVKSVSVVVAENNLEHNQEVHTFNVGDPEFDEIMEVLERYSYHASLGTVSNRIKKTAHVEGNDARYWLNVYLYTEPDCYGDLHSIISGGTGEVIVDYGVYCMGYWGNKTALRFMSEVRQVIDPELSTGVAVE